MGKKKRKSLILRFLFIVMIALLVFGLVYYLPKLQNYQNSLVKKKELEKKIQSLETEVEELKKKISLQEDIIKQLEVEKADLEIKLKIIQETKKSKK